MNKPKIHPSKFQNGNIIVRMEFPNDFFEKGIIPAGIDILIPEKEFYILFNKGIIKQCRDAKEIFTLPIGFGVL